MNPIHHRGDGIYLESGWVIPLVPKTLQSLGTVSSASHQELQCHLHNPDIESKMVFSVMVGINWMILSLCDKFCFLCLLFMQ